MHLQDFFVQAVIYLLSAVISVPIAKRLGLGSVLGYLIAGIIIGPFVLGFIGDEGADIMHFAEFGVVMMLFLIGLELKPSLLWQMRRSIFGLGGGQVVITALIISVIAFFFGMNIYQSIAIGLILALSSTAIVLQTMAEKGLMKTDSGKSIFSVLLFQDIAVIPILAILPLFAGQVEGLSLTQAEHASGISSLPGWQQFLVIVAVVVGIILVGRFLERYAFRFIASSGLREIFTAFALLMVVAIALVMNMVGLSPALGAFVGGVVLAESEYRHELETDIEPFKGLLLGLFFIAVGASINFSLLAEQPWVIVGLLFALIIVKFIVLYSLAKVNKLKGGQEMWFSFALAQGGEFAFVLIAFSSQNAIFTNEVSGIILIVVALSMLLTPLLLIVNERLIQPSFGKSVNKQEADTIDEDDNQIIIAGYGRFGVVMGRLLKATGVKATILDNNPENIKVLRKFGHKVFYGDSTRHDLLETAGIAKAKVIVIAIDEEEQINELAKYLKHKYPDLKILARALNVRHSFELRDIGVNGFRRETYDSSLEMGVMVLTELGHENFQAQRAARSFKYHDQKIMTELYKVYKEESSNRKYIDHAKRFSEQLETILIAERENATHEYDHAWDVESLREELREIYADSVSED